MAASTRVDRLRALGVEPLRLRRCAPAARVPTMLATAAPAAVAIKQPNLPILRLALLPDSAELADPAIHMMYAALTEAVAKVGLQAVRVCDVAADPQAALLVFGVAVAPAEVPGARVLHTEALHVLHADRERKRLLWVRLQALGRGEVA